MHHELKQLLKKLQGLAKSPDPLLLKETLKPYHIEDLSSAFQRLLITEGLTLIESMDIQTASEILTKLPTEIAKQYIGALPDTTVAYYLDSLPMNDALEMQEELGEERFQSLLHMIPESDAQEINRLLAYPKNSVGRLMTEKYVQLKPDDTAQNVLEQLRQHSKEEFETIQVLFVISPEKHLLGVISLRELLSFSPDQIIQEVMNKEPVTSSPDTRAEDVARLLLRYGFDALPIINQRGRMVGIFSSEDAQTILDEADTEDVLKLGAVSGEVEAYLSLSLWQLVKRRTPWLLGLFVAESFTGSVLRHYGQGEESLQLNPIMYFVPLLIGAGGNSGSQVTTTITRALAVGEIDTSDFFLVMRREMSTSLVVGTILGIAAYFNSLRWHTPMDLCLTVSLTLPLIIIWAATVGSTIPIFAKRIGIDPAVISAPLITTFVDATGLIIYLELVKHIHF